MSKFHINDPSLESQWRAIILFGKNTATYKFALAKSLIELTNAQTTSVRLDDLAIPFSNHLLEHYKSGNKQGNFNDSPLFRGYKQHLNGELTEKEVYKLVQKEGFRYVLDAFHNVSGGLRSNFFSKQSGGIVIHDEMHKLISNDKNNLLGQEVESRWKLVETAWNLNISPDLIEVNYDGKSKLFLNENGIRKDVTSARGSLSGYQNGKCFYTPNGISIIEGAPDLCDVDHLIPHYLQTHFLQNGVDLNGVWNLVLSDSNTNRHDKRDSLPDLTYLRKLYDRNESYIASKHPLAETIVNQTGKSPGKRRSFLEYQMQRAVDLSGTKPEWLPKP